MGGMRYEWDERKREANLRKHGLDFVRADLAAVDGVVLKLVYTLRAGTIRCISFRPASKRERAAFYEISNHQKN